jgi:amino-acid N-acetyltransferase
MDTQILSQVDLIREAFHYQSRFEGSTMVFKVDFPVTGDPAFPYLLKDMALLAKTGFRVVIVPGARERIDAVMGEYHIVSAWTGDPPGTETRITTREAMPFVEMAAFHTAALFMTGLSAGQAEGVIGSFVRARGMGVINGRDMENSGTVDRVLADSIGRVLNQGMVPILPCIGYSGAGRPYNVQSDEIALSAAAALGAAKLFFISADGGLRGGALKIPPRFELGENGRIIRLTPQEAAELLAENGTAARPLQELALALRAVRAGVERIHIIDGREEGAVLRELFSNLGSGTMVYAGAYESIRPVRGADIPDLLRLMEPSMRQGILIRRDAEDILERMGDYGVFEIDGSIHACGALRDWGEGQGEIAAVATDPLYADMGLGRKIVRCLIGRAEKKGLRRVFVLTTRTQDWFEALGFKEAAVASLPEEKRRRYDRERNSKVFALDLG